LVDSELGTVVDDGVVVEFCERSRAQCRRDVIGRRTGVLACDARIRCGDTVGRQEVGATTGSQWYRVRVTVSLAVGISGPGGCALLNLEVLRDEGQVVVVAAVAVVDSQSAEGNGVESRIFTSHATQCTGEGVGEGE